VKRFALTAFVLMHAASTLASWRLVGEGDCPGRQIVGSDGGAPDADICTPEFAGKTALCFEQVCYPGCQYIDMPTVDCKGGAELARVYTCEPDSGVKPVSGGGGK